MSELLLDKIDELIKQALSERVPLSELRMAIHDRYIDLEDEA